MSGTLRCTRAGAKKSANDGVREVSIDAEGKSLHCGWEGKETSNYPSCGEIDFEGTIRPLKRRTMS